MKNTLAPRENKALTPVVDPAAAAMTVQQVLGQVALIQQIMGAAMKDGEHYGRIPGCGDKPTLLKPGAEKLCLTFRIAPTYELDERTGEHGHREYRVQCTLSSIINGNFLGQGVGLCSTMEGKYRFRTGAAEVTDRSVPRGYWDLRGEDPARAIEMLGGKGFTVKKVDGKGWMIAKGGEKVENDNPADHYNTVLKMAKKRALVDAVLTATAASDIFTQDLEDITANLAAAGAGQQSDTLEGRPTSGGPVDSGASAPRGSGHAPAAPSARPARPEPPVQEAEVVMAEQQALATRIHFGKNTGLMLHELSPQQRAWYFDDWLTKKERAGATCPEDEVLMDALKTLAPLPKDKAKPPAAATASVQPEDENQEGVSLDKQLETTAVAVRVTLDELAHYIAANGGKNGLPKCNVGDLLWLPDDDKIRLMEKLPGIAPKIIAARRAVEARDAVSPKA